MHTCCTWLLLYATPTHLPSICPFTRPYVLISALSMYLAPVLWAWIRAPATHFLGAHRQLLLLLRPLAPCHNTCLPPFSVIVLSSQYLFQRGPIWIARSWCSLQVNMDRRWDLSGARSWSAGIGNKDTASAGVIHPHHTRWRDPSARLCYASLYKSILRWGSYDN